MERQIDHIKIEVYPDVEITISSENDEETIELATRIRGYLAQKYGWNPKAEIQWIDEKANLPKDLKKQ